MEIGDFEKAVEARDQAERAWKDAWDEAKRAALDTEDQLRQASEAYYFEGGRKT